MKKLLFIPLIFICSFLYADPSISTYSDGSISGTGFGTKAESSPNVWDTFENGTTGSFLKDLSLWRGYGGRSGASYSNVKSYSGQLSAYNNITVNSGDFQTNYQRVVPSDEVYYTYQIYYQATGTGTALWGVGKLGRITSNYSGPITYVRDYNGPGDTIISNYNLYYNANPSNGFNIGNSSVAVGYTKMQLNKWFRIEMYKKLSTPGGTNGRAFFNNIGMSSNVLDNVCTREAGFDFQLDSILLGLMYANASGDADIKIWIDDVYVDNTQARIELGNAPIFANCTHREIQIPTAWSDTSITFTLNQGTFATGSTAYLFVIDSNGVASAGYPITVGGTATDTTSPYVDGRSPAANATNVAINTNIIAHVKDAGDGVDQSTIVVTVEGVNVTSSCTITGTSADYTITYNPASDFAYEQVVNVTIDADDLASNSMTQVVYSFTCVAEGVDPNTDANVTGSGTATGAGSVSA